jgi:hypothetical protein
MPSLRPLCSGKRLRGVVGGLRRIGLLRFWVGLVVCATCDKNGTGYFSRCRASVFSILEAMLGGRGAKVGIRFGVVEAL